MLGLALFPVQEGLSPLLLQWCLSAQGMPEKENIALQNSWVPTMENQNHSQSEKPV